MTSTNVDLSALISTRICHDLISPIGAINNGLELLDAVGAVKGPELSLVGESATSASAKLNVFRLAFGDASSDVEVKADRLRQFILDMYEGSRMTIDWTPDASGYVRSEAKLVLLLLFCIDSSAPLGGTCQVSRTQDIWNFKVLAQKWNLRPHLWDLAAGKADVSEISPSDVHFLIAQMTAEATGRVIRMESSETEMQVFCGPA